MDGLDSSLTEECRRLLYNSYKNNSDRHTSMASMLQTNHVDDECLRSLRMYLLEAITSNGLGDG